METTHAVESFIPNTECIRMPQLQDTGHRVDERFALRDHQPRKTCDQATDSAQLIVAFPGVFPMANRRAPLDAAPVTQFSGAPAHDGGVVLFFAFYESY